MTTEYKEQVAQAIEEHVGEGKRFKSQADLARKAKVNDAYISSMKGRKWDNHSNGVPIPERFIRDVAKVLGVDETVLPTEAYKRIRLRLLEAKINHECTIIDAPTGTGKSRILSAYLQENPSETYLVKASGDMTSWHFMKELARQVGATTENNAAGNYELRRAVEAKLRKEKKPQVLIDEAENMTDPVYDSIKAIYDSMEDSISIVLIGANDYYPYMKRRSKVLSTKNCIPQIFSRFNNAPLQLEAITKGDIRLILDHYGVADKAERDKIASNAVSARWIFKYFRKRLMDAALQAEAQATQNGAALNGKEAVHA